MSQSKSKAGFGVDILVQEISIHAWGLNGTAIITFAVAGHEGEQRYALIEA